VLATLDRQADAPLARFVDLLIARYRRVIGTAMRN